MSFLRRGRLRREARVLDHDAATALGVAALWFLPVATPAATSAPTSAAAAPTLRVAPASADQRRRLVLLVVMVMMVVVSVDIAGGAGDDDAAAGSGTRRRRRHSDNANADLVGVGEVILLGQFPPRADSGLPLASARRQ